MPSALKRCLRGRHRSRKGHWPLPYRNLRPRCCGVVARRAGMRQAVAGRGGHAGRIWRIGQKRKWCTRL